MVSPAISGLVAGIGVGHILTAMQWPGCLDRIMYVSGSDHHGLNQARSLSKPVWAYRFAGLRLDRKTTVCLS